MVVARWYTGKTGMAGGMVVCREDGGWQKYDCVPGRRNDSYMVVYREDGDDCSMGKTGMIVVWYSMPGRRRWNSGMP